MTAREAACALNVSEEWVRARARQGKLPSVRLGDAGNRSPQRFRRSDIERLIHDPQQERVPA
jgi:excisionase family DNA binding protein